MHGHVMSWWRGPARAVWGRLELRARRRRRGTGAAATAHDGDDEGEGAGFGGGAFGVRRPLRFLAYKLELDERQVAELARILGDLKTERAQGEVDRRRSLAGFADAVGGATFDEARAKEVGRAARRHGRAAARRRPGGARASCTPCSTTTSASGSPT